MPIGTIERDGKLVPVYVDPKPKAAPPQWFATAIAEGLQVLYAVGLPRQPAAEMAKTTGSTWIRLLWDAQVPWREADAERLRKTFAQLARSCDEWPTPKALLAALPPRTPLVMLPAPKISEEQRQKNLERLRGLAQQIGRMP